MRSLTIWIMLANAARRRFTDGFAYYFVYPERKRNYYPLREFANWLKGEASLVAQHDG